MNPLETMRREIDRAKASIRQAFRGVIAGYRHRGAEPMLIQGEGLAGEPLQDMEFYQHGGFVSGPPAGTKKIILPLGGKTKHSVIIATEYGQYRVEVAPGECALYHMTEPDCWVHLKAGRVIAARCRRYEVVADEEISFTAPVIRANAADTMQIETPELGVSEHVTVGGDMIVDNNSGGGYAMNEFVWKYDNHLHPENDGGGPTDEPLNPYQIVG